MIFKFLDIVDYPCLSLAPGQVTSHHFFCNRGCQYWGTAPPKLIIGGLGPPAPHFYAHGYHWQALLGFFWGVEVHCVIPHIRQFSGRTFKDAHDKIDSSQLLWFYKGVTAPSPYPGSLICHADKDQYFSLFL